MLDSQHTADLPLAATATGFFTTGAAFCLHDVAIAAKPTIAHINPAPLLNIIAANYFLR
jgi:hypothetical protein